MEQIPQLFRPSAHKIQNGKLNINTVLLLRTKKNDIIKALADYKNRNQIRCDISWIGDKKYATYLSGVIKSNGLDNIVTLKVTSNNIAELLPKYNLFYLPSKGRLSHCPPINTSLRHTNIGVRLSTLSEFVKSDFGYIVNRE